MLVLLFCKNRAQSNQKSSIHAKKWLQSYIAIYATLLAGSNQNSGHMACLIVTHMHVLMSCLTCLPQSCTKSDQQKQAKMIPQNSLLTCIIICHKQQNKAYNMQCNVSQCTASVLMLYPSVLDLTTCKYLAHPHSQTLSAKQMYLIFS